MEHVAILPGFINPTSVVLYETKRVLLFTWFSKNYRESVGNMNSFYMHKKVNNNDITVIETFSEIVSAFKIAKFSFIPLLTKVFQ